MSGMPMEPGYISRPSSSASTGREPRLFLHGRARERLKDLLTLGYNHHIDERAFAVDIRERLEAHHPGALDDLGRGRSRRSTCEGV